MDGSDNPFVIISFEPYVTDSIIKGTHFSPLSLGLMLLGDMSQLDSHSLVRGLGFSFEARDILLNCLLARIEGIIN